MRHLIPLLLAGVLAASESVGEFQIRPVIPLTPPQLAALRELIASDAEAKALAAAEATEAERWLAAEPRPLAEIHYEGLVNTDPARIATVDKLAEMDGVAALVRHWQATGAEEAAVALRRFADAWATTYVPTGNDVNENKFVPLYVGWLAVRDGAEPDVRERIDTWVDRLAPAHVKRVKRSRHITNRYTKSVRMVALFGLIRGREEWLDLARRGVERFVTRSLRPDGSSLDFERRDTLTYHCSSLKPPLELATILGERGDDLYAWESPDGASIAKSVAFVLPYARGEKQHREWVDSKVGLDHERAEAGLDKYRKGRLFKPVQAREMLEMASAFDPDILPLVVELSGGEAERYPSWTCLVNAAVARSRE